MARKTLKKGLFITFEGVEGCGKSTHSRAVYNKLKRRGFDCIYIREPGGTKIGEKIRRVLLDRKNKEMSDRTELFLFEANRVQITQEVIIPALKKKKIIICDRFFDSTTAYQGYAGGLNIGLIEKMNRFASGGITPDLTLVLDVKPKTGLLRATEKRKRDRMESKALLYHNRVSAGYRKLAKRHRRIKLIKVQKDKAKTQKLIWERIENVI